MKTQFDPRWMGMHPNFWEPFLREMSEADWLFLTTIN
jgi:hypothetical protein